LFTARVCIFVRYESEEGRERVPADIGDSRAEYLEVIHAFELYALRDRGEAVDFFSSLHVKYDSVDALPCAIASDIDGIYSLIESEAVLPEYRLDYFEDGREVGILVAIARGILENHGDFLLEGGEGFVEIEL
jgi:hypothetical protein